MKNFKERIADAIVLRTSGALDHLVVDEIYDDIMDLVQLAIGRPNICPQIDTWIVRTALGKQGERAIDARIGADQAKPVDRVVEIYTRIYATERECGAVPLEAEQRANRVLEGLTKVGVINGPQ